MLPLGRTIPTTAGIVFLMGLLMADTSIEWTDATWNPVAGCTVISPGCTNCYAMRMAARLDAMGMKKYRGLTRKSFACVTDEADFNETPAPQYGP
jgi:protein gp37